MQVLGRDLGHEVTLGLADLLGNLGVEADALLARAVGHDLVQADEGAAADEQDVGGVDLDELLLRVLATTLGRDAGDGALEDLEQRLLDALARDVTGDREVLGLAGDLVDLVDVDDADLRALDVAVGCGDELEQDVLDVLAHVAALGERRGVGDGERDLQEAGERLRQKRLAGAGGAQKQDVALGELDLLLALDLAVGAVDDATVVVVDGHAHRALGAVLTHDVLGETVVDLVRRREVADERGLAQVLVLDDGVLVVDGAHTNDVRAGGDALVADVDPVGALHKLAHLVAGLAAERAVQLVLADAVNVVVTGH